jgi:hypothetical protein
MLSASGSKPRLFFSDAAFAEIVGILRRSTKLRARSRADREWFAGVQAMLRAELEELLAIIDAQLSPALEWDRLFIQLANEQREKARAGTAGGRPTLQGDVGKTAVMVLADLFGRVAKPRGGIWQLCAPSTTMTSLTIVQ